MAGKRAKSRSQGAGSPLLRQRLAQVRAAERSGESLKAYAAREGLSVHTLYQAKKQARRKGLLPPHRSSARGDRPGAAKPSQPRFVEAVAPVPARAPSPLWRLRFASGEVLESFSPLTDERTLRVIEALRGQP